VVIYSAGSAWLWDSGKISGPWVAAKLVPAGFAVVGVSVRSSSQVNFPGQLYDMKAAVRWLRAHADEYNLDADHIAVTGDSSGGWNAAMMAVTGDVPEFDGDIGVTGPSSAIQAAISIYPPTTFLEADNWTIRPCKPGLGLFAGAATGEFCHSDPDSPESRLLGCHVTECPDKARAADPAEYISAADPPIMILHGQSDRIVPHNQGERLYMALLHACHDGVFISYPLADHDPPWDFLEDDATRAGATIRSTKAQRCEIENPKLITPDWALVIDFLNENLR